jgi:hypothetical protein
MVRKLKMWILWIAALIATSGCDDRATQVAHEAANRQAQQNTVMAELHQEVAAGTRELVAADAKARGDMIGVHHDLQSERARLDTRWSALESERRQIASQRRTESLLVPLIPFIGAAVLVIVLLGFCWYAVGAARSSNHRDFQLEELLVREILPDDPPQILRDPDRERLIGPVRGDHHPPN